MSLEDAIAANTAAIRDLTALTAQLIAVAGGATTDAKAAARRADLQAVLAAYLTGPAEISAQDKLAATLGPLNAHFGVDRLSLVDAAHVDEAIGYLGRLKAAYDAEGVDGAMALDLGLSRAPAA